MSASVATRRPRRVVVTGIGAVSAFGVGVDRLWSGLMAGEQPVRPIELFDAADHRTQLAAFVPEPGASSSGDIGRSSRPSRLSRTDRFALSAAAEAWQMATLGAAHSQPAAGLFFGSSTGGLYEGETEFLAVRSNDGRGINLSAFATHPNGAPGDEVARAFGLGGPCESHASACAASTMAIGAALDSLRLGEVELVVAGGADGLCQTTYGGFNSLRAIDPSPSRPFRADREGLSAGEGAGMLILETEEHALARGATPLAVLAGAASTCDAHHMTAPHPEGAGAARALAEALKDAGAAAADVVLVNAHGTGTPHNDLAESHAIRTVLGDRADSVPVTSSKGAIGHGLGACGALEAVITLMCLRNRYVHPTAGPGPRDPETPVDVVLRAPRPLGDLGERAALVSVNCAFGGANSAIVLQPWTAPRGDRNGASDNSGAVS